MLLIKSAILASVLLVFTSAFAQSPVASDRIDHHYVVVQHEIVDLIPVAASCPVTVVNVQFMRAARYMPVANAYSADPRLDLQLLNKSGKEVEALDFTGRIRVKKSPYQLDSSVIEVPLKLSLRSGTRDLDGGSQSLRLAQNAFGFESLTLERVHYSDGTTWTSDKDVCTYRSQGDLRQAK